MEDEARDLPIGWVRQYDSENAHQFFVDTTTSPPRSIWHHPYDDEEYLTTLPSEERERIQELHRVPTPADIVAESSDEDDHDAPHSAPPRKSAAGGPTSTAELPPRKQDDGLGSVHRFGRKMKDKITSSTHQEREVQRAKRAEAEQKAYETHMAFRRALSRAMETGQPQLLGKDRQGKDVYVQPPQMQAGYGYSGSMMNPYGSGMYGQSRYMRPMTPYQRPYGYGYGGGLGLPLAGGMAGGMLLGGAMGGLLF